MGRGRVLWGVTRTVHEHEGVWLQEGEIDRVEPRPPEKIQSAPVDRGVPHRDHVRGEKGSPAEKKGAYYHPDGVVYPLAIAWHCATGVWCRPVVI